LITGIVFIVYGQKTTLLEEDNMNTTIAVTEQVTTLINVLTFEPENHEKVIELLRDSTENVVRNSMGGFRPASSLPRTSAA
jgi:hypothetical protein